MVRTRRVKRFAYIVNYNPFYPVLYGVHIERLHCVPILRRWHMRSDGRISLVLLSGAPFLCNLLGGINADRGAW